jgi:DNA polymerase-3 subunit delta
LDLNQIKSSIDNAIYQPVYFLQGENTYYIDEVANKLLNSVLDESEKDFNQTIFYGKDTSIDVVLDCAKRYPLMSPYQLIVVREAQHLSRTIDQLENYFKDPVSTTILVFCFKGKKLDKRKSLAKILLKNQYLFDADSVKDYLLPDWVMNCAKQNEVNLNQKAAVLISEFLGNDLAAIEKNIQKLKLLAEHNQKVDVEMVQKHIGFSKDFNLFELTDAIAAMNVQKASFIAQYFGKNTKNHPVVVTIGHLYGFFTKLIKYHFYERKLSERDLATKIGVHPFFLKQYNSASKYYSKSKLADIVSELRYYDLLSKGLYSNSVKEEDILKELIFKIMH